MTTTTFDPKMDLNDEYVTLEELRERIQYCDKQSEMYSTWTDKDGEVHKIPDRWSPQYAARSLFLTSQYLEQWDTYLEDTDVEGKVFIEEMDYIGYMESLCEDYAFRDVLENGRKSLYAWMVWSLHWECHEFIAALAEFGSERDLPVPQWVQEEWGISTWEQYWED